MPRKLHYGNGSPWIDIRLRCGGALHVLVERVAADCPAADALLDHMASRTPCRWLSDGEARRVETGDGPLLTATETPFRITRHYAPTRRLIVSGDDPVALALAALGASAGFETVLVRPEGPQAPPPLAGVAYRREDPAVALAALRPDRWTAFVGATHEDHHDLAGCLAALRGNAGYVGMIGARSRSAGRLGALRTAGASEDELSRLRLSPGITGLGKAPWEVATGIIAEVMAAMNAADHAP